MIEIQRAPIEQLPKPDVGTEKIHFPYLDVVRFIAAFMIVIVHSYESWWGWFGQVDIPPGGTYRENLTLFGKLVDRVFHNLDLGVDIFFLLSGFLITYILLEEKKRTGSVAILKFMIRRSLRIWPLYFFLIAITPLIIWWLDEASPQYLPNLLFLNNFNTIHTQQWTYPFGHFWSICIEEHFYLVWPFIIAFIPKRRLLSVFLLLILTSIFFRIYTSYTNLYPWHTIFLHTLSRMDVIVIGAIGGYFYSEKQFSFMISATFRISLFLALLTALAIEPNVLWNTPFLAGFKKYFYIVIFSILLLDYNFNPNLKHFIKARSFVHYLGKVSYGIYMYSNILLAIIVKKIMIEYEINDVYVFFSLVIILSLLIPIVSYELFEKHILKLAKRFQVIKTER